MLAPEKAPENGESLDGSAIELRGSGGEDYGPVLRWIVPVLRPYYRFAVNGSPFRVRRATCIVRDIFWKAGQGWPWYTTYCPQPYAHPNGTYRPYQYFKLHQIVPSIGIEEQGCVFWGCASSFSIECHKVGTLAFGVNDTVGDYGDNVGRFEVLVTNWG
jgi:hypothetical protein